MNNKLTVQLEQAIKSGGKVAKKANNLHLKYATFIVDKVHFAPKFSRMLLDRTPKSDFIEKVRHQDHQSVSLVCLQLLCDLLVQTLTVDNPEALACEEKSKNRSKKS